MQTVYIYTQNKIIQRNTNIQNKIKYKNTKGYKNI